MYIYIYIVHIVYIYIYIRTTSHARVLVLRPAGDRAAPRAAVFCQPLS